MYHFIASFDLFGYKLDFNYQAGGKEYRTCSGGLVSIIIRIFVYSIFGLRFYQMIGFQNPNISLEIIPMKLDQIQKIQSMNDTDFDLYIVILDNYNQPKEIENIRTFVNIKGA